MNTSRFRLLFWFGAAAVLLAGLTGAALCLHLLPLDLLFQENAPAALPGLRGVECLGRVDVEGGLLDLAPMRLGSVVEAPVRAGTEVSAGTILLRLDDRPARLQVQQSRAALRAAQAQLAQAEEAARLHPIQVAAQEALQEAAQRRMAAAREELRLKEQLSAQSLISKEDMIAARDQVEELKALARAEEKKLEGLRGQTPAHRVEQAKAEVARAQALLAEAEYALDQCVVRAPEAGRVLQVRTGPGEVVAPQKAVLLFAPARPRIVRAEVEQEFIHLVEVGQPALVRDELNPDWSCKGRVTRVGDWYSPPSIPQRLPRFTDVATVECLITLDPGHPPLRIGRRLTVLIGGAISSP